MAMRLVAVVVVVAAFAVPVLQVPPVHAVQQKRVALVRHDHVKLYAHPWTSSHVLATLVEQTQLQVLHSTGPWTHVLIWASVRGWIRSADIVFRAPWDSRSTYRAPEIHSVVRASAAQALKTTAVSTAPTAYHLATGSTKTRWLPAGTRLAVTAWRQDSAGKIWYRTSVGWVLGDTILFQLANPAWTRVHGAPLSISVSGKGMWLTLGTVTDTSPQALVAAAKRNGISHLYVEAAISPLGFHGRGSVGPLIEAAHKLHIAVIAWVYPYLTDIASDIALTLAVAAYRTAHGDSFDGIAADLERNVAPWTIRGYSQIVRWYLGSRSLLVGVTYPPQSSPDYPFAEVAHFYNVIAPMDYWHQTDTSYGLDYGHMRYSFTYAQRYARDSVDAIQRITGRVSVAPIGQTFDNFGRLEMGPHAPSADEISGFLRGSKARGAIGVSFFQWMSAQVAEWRTIHDFRY